MRSEFLVSFFDIMDILYRLIQFIPVRLATIINLLPLFGGKRVVELFRNLEFEVEGNARARSRRLSRLVCWIIHLQGGIGFLVLLPTGLDNLLETRIPGISAVSLRRCEFSLFSLGQPQIGFGTPCNGTRVVVVPGADLLSRNIN